MSEQILPAAPAAELLMSTDPAQELLRGRAIDPPARPGLVGALGRYDVLRLLGKGGMGTVLLARDGAGGDRVAIKLLNPELMGDPHAQRCFLKEARHMEQLSHPASSRCWRCVSARRGRISCCPSWRAEAWRG